MADLIREVLGKGRSIRFCAKGTSMSPFIRDRDVITVSPAAADTLGPGQVIAFVFQPEGKLCVHRIIRRQASGLVTQGDNLARPDGLVAPGQVLGRVTRVERNNRIVSAGNGIEGRLIARFRHTPVVRALLAGLRYVKTRNKG